MEIKISRLAKISWNRFIEETYDVILPQIIEIEETLKNIANIVNMVRQRPEQYTEPQVLEGMLIDEKLVYAYVTGTLKIGLAQIPRYRGRRISVRGVPRP